MNIINFERTGGYTAIGGDSMKEYTVRLKEISDVKTFVDAMMSLPDNVDLVCGRYTVDAKSIMGIFSLDLSKPLQVVIDGDDDALYQRLLAPYFAEQVK